MIGGDSSCAGYTQEERRVLNEILGSRVSVRSAIVHNALRIVCQAILEDPQRGYPGSLMELRASLGGDTEFSSGEGVAGDSGAVLASTVDDAPDWLTASAPQASVESEPAPEPQEPPKDDPERELMRSRAQSFMG